ncbi:hypothetical protein LTR56_017890 [Elasticomyces elasticus]|nr:hypothetical protein LTR56_017890 [Elasticomyces elasticus]KAK3637141.1 hypothetical protein LTR22_018397 [Elasticomyces elasticus]KAK5733875.1 hypothetical protein LTS12_026844 [Elasticomyces elasticus]
MEMMRAVTYHGIPFSVNVTNVPRPTIMEPTDVIVRMTLSAICGTDLHIYHGLEGGNPPWVMGHEGLGTVWDVGSAVETLKVGDYVVIPDSVAEYARVPYAQDTLIPIIVTTNTTSLALEQNLLSLSDIFATGWQSLDFAGFKPGDSVAVFGAGPVGLLAALAARIRGASRVFSIDRVGDRLNRAASIGAIPIDFSHDDPVVQIKAYEPHGVSRSVDCVGMEAVNAHNHKDEGVVMRNMIDVTASGGGIGQIGIYHAQNSTPGAPLASTISPKIVFPISDFWLKGLSYRAGVVDPKPLGGMLLGLISNDRAFPNFINSSVISIEEAPEYYKRFDAKEEIKVYIRFEG